MKGLFVILHDYKNIPSTGIRFPDLWYTFFSVKVMMATIRTFNKT